MSDSGEITVEQPFDEINKARHYNVHPSGAECIDLIEVCSYNLGSAIKYLWRCDEKHESPDTDLKKAVFYLRREAARLENLHGWPTIGEYAVRLSFRVFEAEPRGTFLAMLMSIVSSAAMSFYTTGIKMGRPHLPAMLVLADRIEAHLSNRLGSEPDQSG